MNINLNERLYNIPAPNEQLYNIGNEKEIGKRWDSKALIWDEHLYNQENHLNQDNAYDEFITVAKNISIERMSKYGKGTLLDLGCGTGLVSNSLQEYYDHIAGIDVSKQMLILARNKLIPNAKFYYKSIFEISPEWNTFDQIVSRGILLSHYGHKYIDNIFILLYSSLRKNGSITIDFLNKDANKIYHRPKNKAYFSSDEVKNSAIRSGFSRVEIIGYKKSRVLFAVINKA